MRASAGRGPGMRGRLQDQAGLFSYVSPESRVPPNHPLRQIRRLVREVFQELSPSLGYTRTFSSCPAA